MHRLCLPVDMHNTDMHKLEQIIVRQRIAKGGLIYETGREFDALYAVRFGHFKIFRTDHAGTQQITGFQMAGDLMGMDAIASGKYMSNAIALEDSEVCIIPFDRLERLLADIPSLLRQFHRVMSSEISRDQNVMMLLNSMRAAQRLASFLVSLSTRYSNRGYAANEFQLRMTREDIGNHLGLAVESVSRLLGDFKKDGILRVNHRTLEIIDSPRLKTLATGD